MGAVSSIRSRRTYHAFVTADSLKMEVSSGKEEFYFWDRMPCFPLKINRRFRRTWRFHVQGRGISRARSRHAAGCKQRSSSAGGGGDMFLFNAVWLSAAYRLISQKMELFNFIHFAANCVSCLYCHSPNPTHRAPSGLLETAVFHSIILLLKQNKLRGVSPRANYTDRASAACRRS
jgi:hypothetical protein